MKRLVFAASLIMTLPFAAPGAFAMGSDSSPPPPTAQENFNSGKKAIYAGRYDRGINLMEKVVRVQPKNADAFNYLGFAYRKKGDLNNAAKYYKVALEIDPDHKGALEYQGEMYLKLDDLAAARGNLGKLAVLCPSGCDERAELTRAIADYLATKPSSGSS